MLVMAVAVVMDKEERVVSGGVKEMEPEDEDAICKPLIPPPSFKFEFTHLGLVL